MIQLDDWQEKLVNEAMGRIMADADNVRHVINAPTGGGKTEIGIAIIKRYLEDNPQHCAGWLSERTILRNESTARINSARLRTVDHCKNPTGERWLVPGRVNVLSPQTFCERGLADDGTKFKFGQRPTQYDVSAFSETSLDDWWSADSVESAGGSNDSTWGILVVDECHHAIADFYGSVVRAWQGPVIGLTATAWLMNPKQSLGENMASKGQRMGPFHTLIFGPTPAELVGKRLSDIEILNVPYRLQMNRKNLRTNRMSADGYDGESVDLEVDRLLAIGGDIVDAWEDKEMGCERPTLWFTRTKAAAAKLCELFEDRNYKTAIVIAETPEDERRRALDDLMAGRIQCLASVDVFGEGVNVPNVNSIGMLRPTCSLSKHRQFLGRGLRIRPDGSPLFVMDFAGNCAELGSPLAGRWDGYMDPDMNMGLMCRKLHKGVESEAFPTECKECGTSVNWNQEECSNCKHPVSWLCESSKIKFKAYNAFDQFEMVERDVAGCWVRHYWKRFEKSTYENNETVSATMSCRDARKQEMQRYRNEQDKIRDERYQAEREERQREHEKQQEAFRKAQEEARIKEEAERAERIRKREERAVRLPIKAYKDDVLHSTTFVNGVAIVMEDGVPVDSFTYISESPQEDREEVKNQLEAHGFNLVGEKPTTITGRPVWLSLKSKWGVSYRLPAGHEVPSAGDVIIVKVTTSKGRVFNGEYKVINDDTAEQIKIIEEAA